MKGYEIFEQRDLNTFKEDGISPYEKKMGLLDFLRELTTGDEGIARVSSFMVVGIDDVLYLTKPAERRNIARAVHKILQSAASNLDRKNVEVQIVCKGRLVRGDSLWIEYRGERLPIDLIFGSAIKLEIRGCPVYTASYNLSS